MTTLSIILFYIGIVALLLLAILLFDNLIRMFYWMWKNKHDKTNTPYESKKVKQHKKSLIIIVPVILAIAAGIFIYHLPVGFDKIVGHSGSFQGVEKIYIRNYGNDKEVTHSEITNKDEINNILNTLSGYRYQRNIDESRFGNVVGMMKGTDFINLGIIITKTSEPLSYISLDITNEGYIYDADSGQAYKVYTDNEGEFFNRLNMIIDVNERI